MMSLSDLSHDELAAMHEEQTRAYDELLTKGLKLDLTRGKPSPAQLDLSMSCSLCRGGQLHRTPQAPTAGTTAALKGCPGSGRSLRRCSNVPVDQLVAGDNSEPVDHARHAVCTPCL